MDLRYLLRNVPAVRAGLKALAGVMCLACIGLAPMESRGEESQNAEAVRSIEYENLRELLIAGNLSLKKEYEDHQDSIDTYQEMWDIMKREQGDLEDRAEEAQEEGDENASLYSSNAASLRMSASRIYSQLESLTNAKSQHNLEKSANSTLITAQTLMNSYLQMAANVEASQKNVEALTAAYRETLQKQVAGTVTAADVTSAKNQLDRASNSLESLREQAASLRRQLLTMVGMPVDSDVVIGSIPEPDLAAIDSIDFETDKTKAVNNSSSVISTRHTSASGTGAWNRRARAVDEAEGTAESSIVTAYQNLLARRTEYEAALSAFQSAQLTYQSLQHRQQAGLLSNTAYLQGEADYLERKASRETASMNLVQAYESYCWEVKGVT